jgi:hypothetical protein
MPPPPTTPPLPPAGADYGQPYQAYAPARKTNTTAIVALILSLAGLIIGISAPIGAIMGHVARRQIRQTGEDGEGLALAAIIIGWIITGLLVIGCVIAAIAIIAAIAGGSQVNTY